MTKKSPHKWAPVIKQWADGENVQYRIWRQKPDGSSDWDHWRELTTAPIREDMFIEYRMEPKVEPHRWQHEKETFLAGFPVEFKTHDSNEGAWRPVTEWLVKHCEGDRDGHIWDRDWLEFRVQPGVRIPTEKVAVASQR